MKHKKAALKNVGVSETKEKTGEELCMKHEASGSADQLIKIWDVTDGSCTFVRT